MRILQELFQSPCGVIGFGNKVCFNIIEESQKRFQSPCGVIGFGNFGATITQAYNNLVFQSPCGVIGFGNITDVETLIATCLFQSPCGVIGFGNHHRHHRYLAVTERFSPLAG